MAIDRDGRGRTFDGTDWAEPRQIFDPSQHGVPESGWPYNPAPVLSCTSASFCMLATSGDRTWLYNGSGWSAGLAIPGANGYARSVSALDCAGSACMAVTTQGDAFRFNGTSWALTQNLWFQGTVGEMSVSCRTAAFCMATNGRAVPQTWNGTSWTATSPLADASAGHSGPLSCVTTSWCMYSVDLGLQVWSNNTWQHVFTGLNMTEFACEPDRIWCLIPGSGTRDHWLQVYPWAIGTAARYLGRTVVAPIDCPDVSWCQAVGGHRQAFEIDATDQVTPVDFVADTEAYDVALPRVIMREGRLPTRAGLDCFSPTRCVAVGSQYQTGYADKAVWMQFDGTSWSEPTGIGGVERFADVSCPTSTDCHSIDGEGNVRALSGETWSAPRLIGDASTSPMTSSLTSISCPTASFCASVGVVFTGYGWGGQAVVMDGAWGGRTIPSPGNALNDVSCTATKFCMAVGRDGAALAYQDGAWSSPITLDNSVHLSSVSCASKNLCVAITDESAAYVWTDSTWSSAQVFAPGRQLIGVSCAADDSCVVLDSAGRAFRWTGIPA